MGMDGRWFQITRIGRVKTLDVVMKRIAGLLIVLGLLSQVSNTQAAGLVFGGNSRGDKAFAKVDEPLKRTLLGLPVSYSGEKGGTVLDLSGLECLPEFLVIKGGPGYVVLTHDEIPANKIVDLATTMLRVGRGQQVPDISHWDGYGRKCVPEPSSALAGLLALGLGFAGWKRMRPMN